MQTFVPYKTYEASAAALDRQRLGKQRVETLQVAYALLQPSYGWQAHPAVNMWRGHGAALLVYGMHVCRAWTALGYNDTCFNKMRDILPLMVQLGERIERPKWWGDDAVHDSHKGMLFGKDPVHYEQFYDYMAVEDYVWPSGRNRMTDVRVIPSVHPLCCPGCKRRSGFTNAGTSKEPWWVCGECRRPTEGWLRSQGEDMLHMFREGPLANRVYDTRMILDDSRLLGHILGYEWTTEIVHSDTTGKSARVWLFNTSSPSSVVTGSNVTHINGGKKTMTAQETQESAAPAPAEPKPVANTAGLEDKRKSLKLSRTQVAEAAGITVAQLYRIEKGGARTKPEEADTVREALARLEAEAPAPTETAAAADPS